MSERKVLNKYYPPEFDPSKIPKLKQSKNRTFSIRIMAPFNMRCDTCGEYIYKGKKFNSRKENVDDEDYLGLRIFRFYIKCPRCVAEIAFKTDLANTDYALEAGATRLFEAEKLAHQMAEKERKEKEEDELNPMTLLENRTKASRNEMEQLDQLEELREMNARHARVDHDTMLKEHMAYEEQLLKLQEEEEDKLVQEILRKGASGGPVVRRVEENDSDEESSLAVKKARQEKIASAKPTEFLAEDPVKPEEKKKEVWERSVGSFKSKTSLAGLVKRKTPAAKQNVTATIASSGITKNGSATSTLSDVKPEHMEPVAVKSENDVLFKTEESEVNMASGSQVDVKPVKVEEKDVKPTVSSGLGLVCGYSDSSGADDSD